MGPQIPLGHRRVRTVSKPFVSSMSDCICLMRPVSPMGPDETSTRGETSNPNLMQCAQLPGIHIEPLDNTRPSSYDVAFNLPAPWPRSLAASQGTTAPALASPLACPALATDHGCSAPCSYRYCR